MQIILECNQIVLRYCINYSLIFSDYLLILLEELVKFILIYGYSLQSEYFIKPFL
ncbi:hypothetical protein SDC9_167266 [bioreactor metagenome]|uniref:Uncharacterized protein n=1 Tax=bioreactor metagenome TaxID=1076179 RepID=A0A645FZB7_9ZZZZ